MRLENCDFNSDADHVYLVGGNVINAFALGNIGSPDDFFIIAAEPSSDSNYPLITGNFLDADGNFLFRLVQNTLTVNPGHCSKILSDRVGYEIHDSDDNLILKLSTRFGVAPRRIQESWITTIEGNFYNKNRNLLVQANGMAGFIESSANGVLGFRNGGMGIQYGLNEAELEVTKLALSSHGKIFQPLSGVIENAQIDLDGKVIMPGTVIRRCQVVLKNGNFKILGQVNFEYTGFELRDEAEMLAKIFGIPIQGPPPKS